MDINERPAELGGLPVMDYRTSDGMAARNSAAPDPEGRDGEERTDPLVELAAVRAPGSFAWRLDDPEGWEPREGEYVRRYYQRFCAEVEPASVSALSIGGFQGLEDQKLEPVRDALLECAPRWTGLRTLFYGDILDGQGWNVFAHRGELSAVPGAFPLLEHLTVQWVSDVSLKVAEHPALRSLALRGYGLPSELAREVMESGYPNLERLDLWTGTEDLMGTVSPDDLAPLFEGKALTGVRALALRGTEWTDPWAEALAETPLLERLEVLDLSWGNISDRGALALLRSPGLRRLRHLDLRWHHLSAGMQERLRTELTGVDIDLSNGAGDGSGEFYPMSYE